ncbi:hypothetical protein PBY51_008588 [Eleginops maclovinus]|uniref:LRRNT domain-containing protein n=1 Tax=Eleginops maclovinus TaxID=56733 RepID=A0AAN7WUD4_ELEMC|nr:hypothetical protein PBY51_008588 [Eleginops maclovinus]
MKVLLLLLIFLTVSGYSYVLQPRLTVAQIAELDRDKSDMKSEQLGDVSISVEEEDKDAESTEERKRQDKQMGEGLTPETNSERRMAPDDETYEAFQKSDQMDKLKQGKVEEERESRLVAGIGLHEKARREMITINQQNVEEKGGNGEIEDHMVVSDLTPPFSTSSTQEELMIPAIQIITQSQNPPGVPPPDNHHNVPQSHLVTPTRVSSHPPTAYAKVSPQVFPPSVTLPGPTVISHKSDSTVLPGGISSVLLLEDLLTEDDYCPPECACYGRVVQCSDKGVDKVPYGIPYNSRYILLMNNHIDSIQLDLLNEYASMEFLVLSNNRLKDATIEGAFEGIPALKRLYLNKNLLISVPGDLPLSLEELRLDNNRLSVMSEAAWASCPGLLILSLSNNSLGNGSESLPNAVFSPLSKLRTLNLDHNQLTSVPLGLPLSIKELYLKGNLIEQFRGGAFNGISELIVLDLSSNRLTNNGLLKYSLLNATHLESLNLEGNRLKQVPQHLPHSLKTLNLEGNLISAIKKAVFRTLKNLEHLGLARNTIFKVAPGAFKTLPVLHQLDLCHNTLRQVPRQLPMALHSVALTHNKIQTVPRDAFCWGNTSYSLSGLVRVHLEHNLIDMGKLDAQAFKCLRGFQVVHFY